jgi:molybdopterin-guanine dinucleotide biosynthesis protein A
MNKMISQGITCPRKILINSNTQLLEQPNTRALDNFNTPEDLKNDISKGF